MLNIDTTSFDVIIVVHGVAEVLRTSAWQPLDLSAEERAEQLVSALNLTVSFNNSHQPGSPLDPATPLFITGQMSEDLALIGDIQGDIEYPIEPLTPPLEYPEHLPVSQYAVNLGLALKEPAAPGMRISFTRKNKEAPGNVGNIFIPDINLLPSVYNAWRPSARQVYASLAIVAAIALFFPIYGAATEAMKETSGVRQKYAAVNTLMQKRLAELGKREPLQKAITQYDSIVDMGGGFIDDLAAIRSIAEKRDVKIQTISQSGGAISFNCEAPDYTGFRDFIKDLEQNGRFTAPVIPPEGYPYIKGGPITLQPKPK